MKDFNYSSILAKAQANDSVEAVVSLDIGLYRPHFLMTDVRAAASRVTGRFFARFSEFLSRFNPNTEKGKKLLDLVSDAETMCYDTGFLGRVSEDELYSVALRECIGALSHAEALENPDMALRAYIVASTLTDTAVTGEDPAPILLQSADLLEGYRLSPMNRRTIVGSEFVTYFNRVCWRAEVLGSSNLHSILAGMLLPIGNVIHAVEEEDGYNYYRYLDEDRDYEGNTHGLSYAELVGQFIAHHNFLDAGEAFGKFMVSADPSIAKIERYFDAALEQGMEPRTKYLATRRIFTCGVVYALYGMVEVLAL